MTQEQIDRALEGMLARATADFREGNEGILTSLDRLLVIYGWAEARRYFSQEEANAAS